MRRFSHTIMVGWGGPGASVTSGGERPGARWTVAEQVELRAAGHDDLATVESLTQAPETAGAFAWFGWSSR
jgi:hypothetical protein